MCVLVWSCMDCKCPDECKMGLLSGLKESFQYAPIWFSSVPKHNLMEHDSSLVPRWPLTPITVVWDPVLPSNTHTDSYTHTSAHCFNRLEETAGKLCQTCSLYELQNKLKNVLTSCQCLSYLSLMTYSCLHVQWI